MTNTRKRCRTCRHWKAAIGSYPHPNFCNKVDTTSEGSTLVEISANGNATLYTAPTFGCVLWEPQSEEADARAGRAVQ